VTLSHKVAVAYDICQKTLCDMAFTDMTDTPCSKISEPPWTHHSNVVISTPVFMKIGQQFVVNESVFCFPPHLNVLLTLLCKIVNKIIQNDKHHLNLPLHKKMTTFTVRMTSTFKSQHCHYLSTVSVQSNHLWPSHKPVDEYDTPGLLCRSHADHTLVPDSLDALTQLFQRAVLGAVGNHSM